jgi:hypothetical protein
MLNKKGVKGTRKNPKKPEKPKASTPNGQMIQDLMTKNGVKGAYKDYVAIVGNRLVDWLDSWDIHNPAGDAVGVEGVALVHKSHLHKTFGEAFANRFWNQKLRMRVHPTQEQRNPNAAKSQDGPD